MKRFKIAIGILLCLMLITLASHFVVMNYTTTVLEKIDTIKTLVLEKDFAQAQAEINFINEFTIKNEHSLALFLKREYVAAIITSLATFKAYAIEGSEPDLFAEMDRAINQIKATHHLFFSII